MGGCKLDLSGLGYDKGRAIVNPEIEQFMKNVAFLT